MMLVASFLIAYTAIWTALRLMDIRPTKSALYAFFVSVFLSVLSLPFPNYVEMVLVVVFCLILFVFIFILSTGILVRAIVTFVLCLGICLNGQIVISSFELTGKYLLMLGVLFYVLSLPLWNNKLTLFQENLTLTKDQKKSIYKMFKLLIPGPLLYFFWSLFVLVYKPLQIAPILIFNFLFLLLVLQMLKSILSQMQEHLENILDKQYQKELLGFMQLIRSQRHDFNFHMQTVYGMITKEQYNACKDYIHSMLSTVQSSNSLLPLADPAVSALLNTFQEMAAQKGLRLEVEIHDNLGRIPCSVYEINTILGNLIQNAIDELDIYTTGSRVIHLLIIKRGNYNMIKVTNECHHLPEEMENLFKPGFTTKPSHEGLGLANATKIAEKYGGLVYPEFEGTKIHMIARIPMIY